MAISKQDSNLTGLRIVEEATLGVLPGSPLWVGLEPNSYADFGAQIKTVAREPITDTRQRQKGSVVDLDAGAGFNSDLTMTNMTKWLQGFFFADIREKLSTIPYNGTPVPITGITSSTKTYTAAANMPAFIAGDLVSVKGAATAANNGLKVVSSRTTTTVVVAAGVTADDAAPAAVTIDRVGFQLGSGTSAIALNGNLVQLTDSTKDMTTLGLTPGEWIYIGGDGVALDFTTNATGFARVSRITAGFLEFDKVTWTASAETGTGKTIQIFMGDFLKNELASLIKRRTYQLERSLGSDADGVMSEYLIGGVCNELTINIPQANKVTVDLTYLGMDSVQYTGLAGRKAGTRPVTNVGSAINTSSDFARIKMGIADPTNGAVTPLFAFSTDLKLTIKNNATVDKALGVLGGFEVTVGNFEVDGTQTAYFANVTSVQAVRTNADVTLDIIMLRPNQGIIFDIPLLGLGDGRSKVEKDKAILLNLTQAAAQSSYGNTLSYMAFRYLPTVATS